MTDPADPAVEPAAETMELGDYLARGGRLTSPDNAPPRYRAEVMRLMASFVDSEMAGASGFADVVTTGPGIEARIAAARIVQEKFVHARRVLDVMEGFGVDAARYVDHHPWSDRLPREADIGAARHGEDMRLSVFHYPLQGWTDAVAMNVLMGRATVIQLEELAQGSYQPLTDALRAILPVERRHAELGEEGLARIVERDGREAAQPSVAYWAPRVAESFGSGASRRFETLRLMGLRHRPNAELLARWREEVGERLARLGLALP